MNIVTKDYTPSGDMFLDSQLFGRYVYLSLRQMLSDQEGDSGVIQFVKSAHTEVLNAVLLDAHINVTSTVDDASLSRREALEQVTIAIVRQGHSMWVSKMDIEE